MSKVEYMPVDCLQVPKMLFQVEKFKNLSNTAKILYSLFLDRLKFAVQNGWVDHNGDLFVIYPKSEMKKDLNTTRYGVDQAVQELVKIGKLVRIVQNNGKANHFYINDIYENEMEEESMMTLDRIMANMPMEEREIIMDKMVAASRDILGTIADMGYLDEYETPLTPMEERGYYDEEGNLDIDAVEADGYEFGMDLAFGVLSVCEGKPEHVLEIQKYVNEQYECCSNKKFMKVLETIARMNGNEEVYIEDMYACNKEARNYYLSELMMCFNFVFNEMELGDLFLLSMETLLISITMRILSIIITVILYGRMIEIYLYTSIAPIPFATMTNKEWGNIGNNYLKGLFALAFQGFFMMVCVGIYAVLVNAMTISSDLHAAMFSVAAYTVILAFSLFKTGSLSKSIFNAH